MRAASASNIGDVYHCAKPARPAESAGAHARGHGLAPTFGSRMSGQVGPLTRSRSGPAEIRPGRDQARPRSGPAEIRLVAATIARMSRYGKRPPDPTKVVGPRFHCYAIFA
jgi:hypothetical protein